MTPTFEEAVAQAGRHLATARRVAAAMTPRELAEAAHHAGQPLTVDQLEDRIRADRGLPPKQRETAASP